MRRAAAFLCLLLVSAAPAPPPLAATLSPDTEQRWVPFELTPGNQIRFTMTIDGRPVSAVLDTGVSVSVLSRAFAAKGGLPIRSSGRARAIGGSIAIGSVAVGTLGFGGMTRRGGTMKVVALPASATGSAAPVDALIGHDLIDDYAIDIDFEARRFRLLQSGRLPFTGARAPLGISPSLGVYVSRLTIGTTTLQPMMVDSGDGASITVSRAGWQSTRPAPDTRTTSGIAYGLGGPLVTDVTIAPSLSVGSAAARDSEVRIEPAGGFSQSIGVAGRIGTGFLQRYRVLLDPRAGHMVLADTARTTRPTPRSTSGLLVGSDSGQLRVVHVMRGSPAAATGWRDGDMICQIDGAPRPRDYGTSALAGWSVGAPGRTVALGLCGGGIRQLTLARFY